MFDSRHGVCSFLKGRSFPGTIKLSRKDKTGAASSQAGSTEAAESEHALSKSRSPSQESLGVSTSSQVRIGAVLDSNIIRTWNPHILHAYS